MKRKIKDHATLLFNLWKICVAEGLNCNVEKYLIWTETW